MDRDLVAFLDARVDAHVGRLLRQAQSRQPAGRRQEAALGVLGIEACLHGVATAPDVRLQERQPLARSHAQLPFDEVETRDHLGDRVLDLQPRVHLEEKEVTAVVEEFDRARAAVVDGLRGGHGRGTHRRPRRVGESRRRRLLDDFLVTSLQRAVAFEQVHRVAVRVGKDLDLDMTACFDEAFEQNAIVAERLGGFASRARERVTELTFGAHDPHALAATPGDGLDQQRKPQPTRRRRQGRVRVVFVVVAGQHGYARSGHEPASLALRAHAIDRCGGRADEHDAGRLARARESGVLGQEPVARVDRLAGARARGLQDPFDVEVTLTRRCRPDLDRLVRHAHVQRTTIGLGVDRDRAQPESPRGADDAAGDFAAVGDEEAGEHGVSARKSV